MSALQRALERYQAEERERELARALRRTVTFSILHAGRFDRMRVVIPQWWEWVCTGLVHRDAEIAELIDRRLDETPGLQSAIVEDWA
jgi:hypothetical protein